MDKPEMTVQSKQTSRDWYDENADMRDDKFSRGISNNDRFYVVSSTGNAERSRTTEVSWSVDCHAKMTDEMARRLMGSVSHRVKYTKSILDDIANDHCGNMGQSGYARVAISCLTFLNDEVKMLVRLLGKDFNELVIEDEDERQETNEETSNASEVVEETTEETDEADAEKVE